jgi:hypothetical protein
VAEAQVRLGPLVCTASGVSVESSDSIVQLTDSGISVQGPDPLEAAWSGLVSLDIVGPAMPRKCDLPLKLLDVMAPVAGRRSGRTEISVQTFAQGWHVEVEPGPGAPYDYRELDALEAIVTYVGEAEAWPLLGSPQWLLPVMREATVARTWLSALTYRRVRRIVRTAMR